jgi:hypothetical protein
MHEDRSVPPRSNIRLPAAIEEAQLSILLLELLDDNRVFLEHIAEHLLHRRDGRKLAEGILEDVRKQGFRTLTCDDLRIALF